MQTEARIKEGISNGLNLEISQGHTLCYFNRNIKRINAAFFNDFFIASNNILAKETAARHIYRHRQ